VSTRNRAKADCVTNELGALWRFPSCGVVIVNKVPSKNARAINYVMQVPWDKEAFK
jgi:hypothetical protein